MTERSVTHSHFSIKRSYPASPARVFAACSDPAIKSRWFVGPSDWPEDTYSLDFRVGGKETSKGGPEGGPVHTYRAVFMDIVPDERIVTTYEMYVDDVRMSVSVATIELTPEEGGTRFVYTEQGAFLDGLDQASFREQGTRDLLDNLGALLDREPATA